MKRQLKTVERAYSMLTLKAVDEDAREITGIATTPTPDRCDDIVEPKGAIFTLPIPLLWQHNSLEPIGEVYAAKVTDAGIEIKARIAKIADPGLLKDRLDEAWQSIKAKLVRGLSIGFKPKEYSFIDDGSPWGAIRHLVWEWLELSAVTIPCNDEANIATIKAIDIRELAASGRGLPVVRLSKKPGVSGKTPASITSPGGHEVKTLLEKLEAFRTKRAELFTKLTTILEAAGDGTLDAAQKEDYDTTEAELKAVDDHIARLDRQTKSAASTASPALGSTIVLGAESRQPGNGGLHVIRAAPKLGPGIAFARVIRCIGLAKGNLMQAELIAKARYADDKRIENIIKGNILAGQSGTGWATNLVGDESAVFADFVEFLRPQTIVGKFGQGGIPDLHIVPFDTPLIGQTGGGAGYWVGEGKPKPLTSFDFARTTLSPLKVANIAVVTEELLRRSSPSVDTILRNSLVAALRARMDIDFIDPAKAASAGVSPASILNGVAAIPSTGVDADAVREDIRALFQAFIDANNQPTSAVLIMQAGTAMALGMMQNPLGQSEFPGINMNGGTLLNIPAIVSEHVPDGVVALVNASDIYFADDGDFSVDLSREASLQMLDNPTNDSVTPTPTSMVSMFQTNSVAFRAERVVNWARRRASAVAHLSGVAWGAAVSP